MTTMTEVNEDTVRAEARAWLEANWSPDYGLVEWRLKLAESGWGVPHWPSRWYGRDLPVGLVPVVEEEFKRIGAIGVAKVGIRTLAAATILAHGTDLQKEKFLLRILTGEDIWCQLFSEPGSGSDVAGAVTRAEFRGNQWVVNGQKVWTTSAHKAHWGLLLARTDWDKPKHPGLSYFILDMKQPGVTVQPLRQMNGYASFNDFPSVPSDRRATAPARRKISPRCAHRSAARAAKCAKASHCRSPPRLDR
jgi:alkylation response protein AidB-like acyl-CoA dehydrogenase